MPPPELLPVMSPSECIEHAALLSRQAETASNAEAKAILLQLAEAWLDFSQFANMHDDVETVILQLLDLIQREHELDV